MQPTKIRNAKSYFKAINSNRTSKLKIDFKVSIELIRLGSNDISLLLGLWKIRNNSLISKTNKKPLANLILVKKGDNFLLQEKDNTGFVF